MSPEASYTMGAKACSCWGTSPAFLHRHRQIEGLEDARKIASRLISDRSGRAASRLLSIPWDRVEAGTVAFELRRGEEARKAEWWLGPATGPVLLDASAESDSGFLFEGQSFRFGDWASH